MWQPLLSYALFCLLLGKFTPVHHPKLMSKRCYNMFTLAIATSGISYIACDLVKDLLEKISGSESVNVLIMPLSDTTRMKQAWMSCWSISLKQEIPNQNMWLVPCDSSKQHFPLSCFHGLICVTHVKEDYILGNNFFSEKIEKIFSK